MRHERFTASTKTMTVSKDLEGKALRPRELEVLHLLSKGCSVPQLSEMLRISKHTVSSHIRCIYIKLHVANRAEAVAWFVNRDHEWRHLDSATQISRLKGELSALAEAARDFMSLCCTGPQTNSSACPISLTVSLL